MAIGKIAISYSARTDDLERRAQHPIVVAMVVWLATGTIAMIVREAGQLISLIPGRWHVISSAGMNLAAQRQMAGSRYEQHGDDRLLEIFKTSSVENGEGMIFDPIVPIRRSDIGIP
jgi:hypothetical protein